MSDETQRSDPRRAEERATLFAEHRPYLFAVAYRMLGIAEDAEDTLQDAWLRFAAAPVTAIEHPRAYLVTTVTRLCLDLLRSARHRREEYVGVWLPEPVPTHEALADDLLEKAQSASFAFLLLLERLNPLQRAVLVLHDVFDYSHDEVAAVIDRSTIASRQILRRARRKLGGATPPEVPPTAKVQGLAAQFFEAARSGNVEGLLGALAADVVLLSDGGGQVPAVRHPLVGSLRVGRFLGGVRRKGGWGPVTLTELNGQPALLTFQDGSLNNAFLLDITSEGVTAIYVVRNPDKLRRLARGATLEKAIVPPAR